MKLKVKSPFFDRKTGNYIVSGVYPNNTLPEYLIDNSNVVLVEDNDNSPVEFTGINTAREVNREVMFQSFIQPKEQEKLVENDVTPYESHSTKVTNIPLVEQIKNIQVNELNDIEKTTVIEPKKTRAKKEIV